MKQLIGNDFVRRIYLKKKGKKVVEGNTENQDEFLDLSQCLNLSVSLRRSFCSAIIPAVHSVEEQAITIEIPFERQSEGIYYYVIEFDLEDDNVQDKHKHYRLKDELVEFVERLDGIEETTQGDIEVAVAIPVKGEPSFDLNNLTEEQISMLREVIFNASDSSCKEKLQQFLGLTEEVGEQTETHQYLFFTNEVIDERSYEYGTLGLDNSSKLYKQLSKQGLKSGEDYFIALFDKSMNFYGIDVISTADDCNPENFYLEMINGRIQIHKSWRKEEPSKAEETQASAPIYKVHHYTVDEFDDYSDEFVEKNRSFIDEYRLFARLIQLKCIEGGFKFKKGDLVSITGQSFLNMAMMNVNVSNSLYQIKEDISIDYDTYIDHSYNITEAFPSILDALSLIADNDYRMLSKFI